MHRSIVALIILAASTGCASKEMVWSNPAKTDQEFNKDIEHCIMFADSAMASRQAMMPVGGDNKSMNSFANGYNIGNAIGGPAAADKRYYDCMARRGWNLVEKNDQAPAQQQAAATLTIQQTCEEWLAAGPGSPDDISMKAWYAGYVSGLITSQVAMLAKEKGCEIEKVSPYYPDNDELFSQVTEFCRQHPGEWITAASVTVAMACVDKTEICP